MTRPQEPMPALCVVPEGLSGDFWLDPFEILGRSSDDPSRIAQGSHPQNGPGKSNNWPKPCRPYAPSDCWARPEW